MGHKEVQAHQLKKGDKVVYEFQEKTADFGSSKTELDTHNYTVAFTVTAKAKWDTSPIAHGRCVIFHAEVESINGDTNKRSSMWDQGRQRKEYWTVAYKKNGFANYDDPRNQQYGWHRVDGYRKFTVVN